MKEQSLKEKQPSVDFNKDLKIVQRSTPKGYVEYYVKNGYDYALQKQWSQCTGCVESADKTGKKPWYCMALRKRMEAPCDIFQMDICEREPDVQLKKYWRDRVPLKELV